MLDLASDTMSEDIFKPHFVEAVFKVWSKEGRERYPQALQGTDKASQSYKHSRRAARAARNTSNYRVRLYV